MQKEKIRNSILGILAFVLLFYEIIVLKGENYYLVSMAVLLIALFVLTIAVNAVIAFVK